MDPMVPQFLSGTTPWDDPSAYIKLSAVFRLDKVTTPILMADGYDVGDLLLDSIEMYNGLRWFQSLGAKDVRSLPLIDKASA